MRARNIKINVYLNEGEHNLLKQISNKARLTQSELIRMLINDYDFENKIDVDNMNATIKSSIEDLTKLKTKMQRLAYYQIVEFIDNIIKRLNALVNNDKSNAI